MNNKLIHLTLEEIVELGVLNQLESHFDHEDWLLVESLLKETEDQSEIEYLEDEIKDLNEEVEDLTQEIKDLEEDCCNLSSRVEYLERKCIDNGIEIEGE